ncbi:hypothetical protein OY671_008988, partial [Metschnikowia pulcherrima]
RLRQPGPDGLYRPAEPVSMSRAVAAGPAVVVCSTCRSSADRREDEGGRRGGASLAEALRRVRGREPGRAGGAVQERACSFAGQRHCTVHIRAPGRIGYVSGGFTPDEAAARAISGYAVRHAASAEGTVPYAEWPEGAMSAHDCSAMIRFQDAAAFGAALDALPQPDDAASAAARARQAVSTKPAGSSGRSEEIA